MPPGGPGGPKTICHIQMRKPISADHANGDDRPNAESEDEESQQFGPPFLAKISPLAWLRES